MPNIKRHETENYSFWVRKRHNLPRPIIFGKIIIPSDISDELHQLIIEDFKRWSPEVMDENYTFTYDDIDKVPFAVNESFIINSDITVVHQKAIGDAWSNILAFAMDNLRMRLTDDDEAHAEEGQKMLVHDFQYGNLPIVEGWKILEWKMVHAIQTGGPARKIMCDKVTWEKNFSGNDVKVTTRHGWDDYNKNT